MNEVNQHIYGTLTNASAFAAEMGSRCFPIFAPEKTAWPFTVYSIPGGATAGSKDGRLFTVAVSLFYQSNKYTECCAFTDTVMEIMEAEGYDFQSINAEYDDEWNTIVSSLIFTIYQK